MTFADTLFGLQSRWRRAAYSVHCLLNLVALEAALGALAVAGVSAAGSGAAAPALAALAIALPALLAVAWVVGLALGVKRLHDMRMSGARMIWNPVVSGVAGSVPLVGISVPLGLAFRFRCVPGTDGANRFGRPRSATSGPGSAASRR